MNTVKAGIIGCGGIAGAHLEGFQKGGAEVVALADVDETAAGVLAGKAPGARVFTRVRDLIDDGGVEVVSVCSPPAFHEEAVLYALERGVHVLCEKPLAATPESARRMEEAAARSSSLLMPGFRHRFLPAIRRMRELVPEIGPPVWFHNTFCGPAFQMKDKWHSRRKISGGGVLTDTSSHSIDLFRFMAGEIVQQHAVMHRHFDGTDTEDAGILTVKAENGTLGMFSAAWVAGVGKAGIEIMGQDGSLSYDYTQPSLLRLQRKDDDLVEDIAVEPSAGFAEEIAHLLGAVAGKWTLSCTARDGRRAVEILAGVYGGNGG